MSEFVGFPKIYRASRPCIITEKIDGTNAQVFISDDCEIYAGSRNGYLTAENDNFGFRMWVLENKTELLKLGPGRHFGEWWGKGIQRTYGLKERRFSLFNTERWSDVAIRPQCCHIVEVLYTGIFSTLEIDKCIELLRKDGSKVVPGFMRPEGIVCFHIAGNFGLKKTLEKDEEAKSHSR